MRYEGRRGESGGARCYRFDAHLGRVSHVSGGLTLEAVKMKVNATSRRGSGRGS